MNITEFIEDLEYEFIAQPAWSAHCYNFEYMTDSYNTLIEYMDEQNIQHNKLTTLYEEAEKEFNRICDDPNGSFMDYESTKELVKLDNEFLSCLYDYVELIKHECERR